ncbi:MAG: hypothetical protein AB7N76_08140 [Planctomycetota bacterium]
MKLGSSRSRSQGRAARGAAALLLGLLGAGLVRAQDPKAEDEPPPIQKVYVPRKAFSKVLARHLGGVLLTEAELDKLVAEASKRPAPPSLTPATPAPLEAAIQRLAITGQVEGDTAVITCAAEVAVLRDGVVALPLPLQSLGLEGVWVGEEPAQVLLTDRGACVLVTGSAAKGEAVVAARSVRWRFAQRVQPLDEPGAGLVAFPLPAAASASVSLVVPGELELVPRAGQPTLWTKVQGGTTTLQGADGGGRAGSHLLELAWRPRHAVARLAPYATCSDRSLLTVKRGVVVLDARLRLEVHRAERQSFALELPPGFVVRQLECQQSKLSYLQRADHLEVSLPAPRTGTLDLALAAELPTPAGSKDGLSLELRPLRFLDLQRVDGLFAVAAGPDTLLHFQSVQGLERADLAAYGGDTPGLLRVYRREAGAQPKLVALAKPQEARVGLTLQAALQLEQRQVKALALYRFSVEAGSVFSFRARLPQGYALERALVRDEHGRAIPHRVSERALAAAGADPNDPSQRTVELTLELSQGLRPGQELLLTVEATREAPDGLAGRGLLIPRFEGEPHSELRGYLGFAPDPAFRLAGAELAGLTPIPADELPRVGLDVPGLVLGYRVEAEGYRGRVEVREKETRVSVTELAHHRVHERVLTSELRLDLDVSGAPLDKLVLLVPKGTGPLVTVRGEGVLRETEVLGAAKDGRDRLQVSFARRLSGERSLQVSFQTKLPAPATNGGDETFTASLPQVAVEDATRAHGTLAVFSTGAAEVSAEPTGLRAIEVTEVPALQEGAEVEGRPLFAYTYVRDHALELSVKRHGAAPVLTAVAEELALQTSAGPDGSARHVARFRVKNLSNQFFALKLPEGAALWSVAVDGQGVKPAAQGALQLVPIPTAGTKGPNEVTEVVATYTQQGSPWGLFSRPQLQAPALAFGEGGDAVPVLVTTWSLSLPEDYRVLSVAGNLDGPSDGGVLGGVETLLGSTWRRLRGGALPWAGGALLLGLLVAAWPRGRRGLLVALSGGISAAEGAGGAAQRGAAAVYAGRKLLLVLLIFVLLTGLCLSNLSGAKRQVAKMADKAARMGGGAGSAVPSAPAPGAAWGTAEPAKTGALPKSEEAPDLDRAERREMERARQLEPQEERNELKRLERLRGAEERDKAQLSKQLDELKEESAKLEKKREDATPQKPGRRRRPSQPMADSVDEAPTKEEPAPEPAPPPGADAPPPAPKAPMAPESKPMPPTATTGAPADLPANGPGGPSGGRGALGGESAQAGAGGADGEEGGGVDQGAAEHDYEYSGKADGKTKKKNAPVDPSEALLGLAQQGGQTPLAQAARLDDLGAGGQVGLRSLVLELRGVGAARSFSRPGGDASLGLSLVAERLLVGAGGLLALAGFLAGLLLPRTGKLNAAALVLVALVGATALPALWPNAGVAALLNAFALGVLGAVPVLALVALGRVWESGPFARLSRALAELRAERSSS